MSDEKLIAAERSEAAWKSQHEKVLERLALWQGRYGYKDPNVSPDILSINVPPDIFAALLREMSLLHPAGGIKCPPMTKKLPFFTPSRRRKKTSRSTAA